MIGITWPVPAELDDAELERRLFTAQGFYPMPTRPMPDWNYVHAELRRRGVTLVLLWEEYRIEHPDGYGYSRFCDLYIAWRRGISATMRQTHVAGEKLFVDFAGDTVPVFDGATGEERHAHVFVAVLGASNYTYAEARWSEGLPDWIGAHVNALAFLGGVPKLLVCDNLRAGVTAACRYEPGINRTYQDLATHYGTAILPTRVRRPREGEGRGGGPDRRALHPGPPAPSPLPLAGRAERGDPRVARRAECPADAQARGQPTRVLRDDRPAGAATAALRTLHLCGVAAVPGGAGLPRRGARPLLLDAVAPDPRSGGGAHHRHDGGGVPRGRARGGASKVGAEAATYDDAGTHAERPSPLRQLDAGADPELRRRGRPRHRGPGTAALVEAIMRTKPHPEQGFRACLGILRLAKIYGDVRLEAACQRGLTIGAHTYGSIASILRTGLDRAFGDAMAAEADADSAPLLHANIRGRHYYH